MTITQLEVDKVQFINGEVKTHDVNLIDGEILMEIHNFAYTSNNTTYAVIGKQMGYWKFFPSTSPDITGIIPTWGFATVTESKCPDIAVGKKYYGYYPMASHLVAHPGKITKHGFDDIAEHRSQLPPLYNKYHDTDTDPGYSAATEDRQLIFRPLFMTSFLINSMLNMNKMYGAKQIILTSASSKTALALAYCLKDNNQENIKVVGLTSNRNVEFVTSTNYYNEVITYENYKRLVSTPSVIVDFAGNHNLQADLQEHLDDQLQYNCLVGLVHKEAMRGEKKLKAKGDFFFAPTYFKEAMNYMGQGAFFTKSGQLQHGFIKASESWLEIKNHTGNEALIKLHQDITNGNIDPREGNVATLN